MKQNQRLSCLRSAALVLACAPSWCVGTSFGESCLVQDGKPNADIVISDQPPRMVKLAASELQTYLEKISGARLEIVTLPGTTVAAHIYVGRSAETDRLKITDEGLKYGAFRMVSGRDWLVLLGHDQDFKLPQYAPHSYADIPLTTQEWDARTGEHLGQSLLGCANVPPVQCEGRRVGL